ncbi:hypothetical protein BH23ACT12_BH23ACT12_03960 [soil metagenome]
MSLLVIGSFPLIMTIVLMIAVWAERYLAGIEEPVPVEDIYDSGLDAGSPQAGMAVPAHAAQLIKPEP